jgi:hypothetical protein
MSFQLELLLSFPREVFYIAPPVPVNLGEGPQITAEMGQVAFYFDNWNAPRPNQKGGYPVTVDAFFAHFIPSTFPSELDLVLTTEGHPYTSALYIWELPEQKELRRYLLQYPEEEKSPRRIAIRRRKEARLQELWREHKEHVNQVCDQLFADPILGHYFKEVGDHIKKAIRDFLAILRVEYGQYLIPGTLPTTTGRKHWILSNGMTHEVGDIFLDRLLGLRRWDSPGGISKLIESHHWPDITAKLEAGSQSPFSEVLLASAKGECDPDLGNPRLALIEAVVGLEVEVKKLMTLRLQGYGISRTAIDRIVRETPLADLATTWIRRELGQRTVEMDQSLYRRCAEAIHERNELIHYERRNLSSGRALQHVEVLGKLIRLAREVRESEMSR